MKNYRRLILGRNLIRFIVAGVLIVLAFRFFFVPFKIYTLQKRPFMVRVRLLHDADDTRLGGGLKCNISDARTGGLLARNIPVHEGTQVVPFKGIIKIGSRIFDSEEVRVSPSRGGDLVLGGTAYRGELFIANTGEGLDVINKLELEDYLKGVVPREMNYLWPVAALKAQAIASRSFVLYEALRRRNKDYDITADTFSQVYGGVSGERWRATRAVEATKGKVLEYEGEVLPAYFHSCCGGHTENIARIWGENFGASGIDMEPLKGVRCGSCRWSPHFRWQIRIAAKTIAQKLKEKDYPIDGINEIREGERDDSGRLECVRVRSGDKWFEIPAEEFRAVTGRKYLRSANFRIKKYPFFYFFSGYGWGHGVGMCQWGAFGLSVRRKSAERILSYYYPGARIVNMWEVIG